MLSHSMLELHDLQKARKDYRSGKITGEIFAQLCVASAVMNKHISAEINVQKLLGAKDIQRRMTATGMVSTSTIPAEIECTEMLVCECRGDKLVTREDCEGYSGRQEHIDACQKCDHFVTTRKQIQFDNP